MVWKYAPDAPITTPNVITSISGQGLVPTEKGGYRAPYDYVEIAYNSTLNSTTSGYNGSFMAINTAGTGRLFLGVDNTSGRIYELSAAGTLTDRSRGGNYTAGAFFSFAQLADTTIAGNKSDALQVATTGAFSDATGSPPKAKIVLVDANQVILLNYNDGTDYPDGWWVGDVGSTTSWTPPTTASSTSEARSGRLRDSGGAITAGVNSPFGGVIAFKKNAMYLGRYVGQPKVREWQIISPRIGCKWQEGCVNSGERVYFASDDIYEFDGSQVRSITEGIRNYLRSIIHTAGRVALSYDATKNLLYVWYSTTVGGVLAGAYVYHTKDGRWGYVSGSQATINSSAEASARPIAPMTLTYDEMQSWNSSPNTAFKYSSSYIWFSSSTSVKPASFGAYANSTITPFYTNATTTFITSWTGDYQRASTLQRIVPAMFLTNASSQTAITTPARYSIAVTAKQYTAFGGTTASASATMGSDLRFSLMAQGHWFQATYTIDCTATHGGNYEWLDHIPEYVAAGKA